MATSVLLGKARYKNAKQLVDTVVGDIVELTNDSDVYRDKNYYLFIGRPQPWEDDNTPDSVIDALSAEYDAWYNMTALKKLTDQNIRLGFKRINWTSGVVYDEYDDLVDLTDKNFYVMTSQFNVYKCISNNGGATSTVRPTQLSSIQETTDGYKWKFMFTISQSDIDEFASAEYLPITYDSIVINSAIIGSIENVKVESIGSGYATNSSLPIYVYGDGDEFQSETALATPSVDSQGRLTSVTVDSLNNGAGYSLPIVGQIPVLIRQVTTTGTRESAYGLATTNESGAVVSVDVVIPGQGYINGQQVSIIQSSARGVAFTNNLGEVISATINIAGQNFRKATATVVASSVSPASVRPIISPFRGHGGAPDRELLAKYVLLNITISGAEGGGDFTIANDFRQIGLIEDPYNYGTTEVATDITLNAKRTLNVTVTAGSFVADENIYGQTSGATGKYIDIIDTNILRYIKGDVTLSNIIDFEVGETIISESGATATINSIVDPEVQRFSGDILFINNRVPIFRNADQVETISFVLEY